MKYVLAFTLTVAALVTVFGVHRLIPLPNTFGRVVSSGIRENMPFEIQAAYAESCINKLENEHGLVQFAVADAAVKLKELEGRIHAMKQDRNESTARIRTLLAGDRSDSSEVQLSRDLSRHERLQWKITQAEESKGKLIKTLELLESAETGISEEVWAINDRLDALKMDHALNDAQEFASNLRGDSALRGKGGDAHCTKVLDRLERRERVREELQERFGPHVQDTSSNPEQDPWTRAQETLRHNC